MSLKLPKSAALSVTPKRLFLLVGLTLVSFYAFVYRPYKLHRFKEVYLEQFALSSLPYVSSSASLEYFVETYPSDSSVTAAEYLREKYQKETSKLIESQENGWENITKMADTFCTIGEEKYTAQVHQKREKLFVLILRDNNLGKKMRLEENVIESVKESNYCHKFLGLIR